MRLKPDDELSTTKLKSKFTGSYLKKRKKSVYSNTKKDWSVKADVDSSTW